MIRSPLRETARIVLIVALTAAAALYWLQGKPLDGLHRHSADPSAAADPPQDRQRSAERRTSIAARGCDVAQAGRHTAGCR